MAAPFRVRRIAGGDPFPRLRRRQADRKTSAVGDEQHPLQVTSVDGKSVDELREQISEITGRVKAREANLVLSVTLVTDAFPREAIIASP
ncbi:MAG: hypothetical protein WB607_27745 [Candidatus Acidiferrum sp.]|jgi:hypothetical protein